MQVTVDNSACQMHQYKCMNLEQTNMSPWVCCVSMCFTNTRLTPSDHAAADDRVNYISHYITRRPSSDANCHSFIQTCVCPAVHVLTCCLQRESFAYTDSATKHWWLQHKWRLWHVKYTIQALFQGFTSNLKVCLGCCGNADVRDKCFFWHNLELRNLGQTQQMAASSAQAKITDQHMDETTVMRENLKTSRIFPFLNKSTISNIFRLNFI